MRKLVAAVLALIAAPALAQQAPTLFHFSPSPFHWGTWGPCGIACRQDVMFREYPPGSCLIGTFISADIAVLGQRNVRVKPDAEFWPHNGWKPKGSDIYIARSPWDIDSRVIHSVVDGLPKKLAKDIVSRVGPTSDFQVYYIGADLIAHFGYKKCG